MFGMSLIITISTASMLTLSIKVERASWKLLAILTLISANVPNGLFMHKLNPYEAMPQSLSKPLSDT
jgi:hypothetical protein